MVLRRLYYYNLLFIGRKGGSMDSRSESPTSIHHYNRDEAIKWIMEEYGESLKRFIFTYVKNRSQTDDIFQEVLIAIYQQLHTFQERSSFKTWLYKVTANKCKDYLRSPLHRLFIWKDQIIGGSVEETPDQLLMIGERKSEVIEAILGLPIKYREVLILQYYKELSIQEIGDLLKVNPSTIKTRIMRAKEKLKQKLKEDFLYE